MTEKNYNAIRLANGIQNAIEQALADIVITSLQSRIDAYNSGMLTAIEFLEYIESTKV